MAKVYLPMGYPIQSGNQFENVVYQGGIVRVYTLEKDPRSDAQIENRRFLSDVTKVRSTLGIWGKGACRSIMGAHWGTVIFQVIKADVETWWSGALAEWEDFSEENQEAWRTASPYQATFSDVGQIFFCVQRVIYRALFFWGGAGWGAAEWEETQSAQALAWWLEDGSNFLHFGKYDETELSGVLTGTWNSTEIAESYMGACLVSAGATGETFTFEFIGKNFKYGFLYWPDGGIYRVYIDGVRIYRASQYYQWGTLPTQEIIRVPSRGVHRACIECETGKIAVDWVEFL